MSWVCRIEQENAHTVAIYLTNEAGATLTVGGKGDSEPYVVAHYEGPVPLVRIGDPALIPQIAAAARCLATALESL